MKKKFPKKYIPLLFSIGIVMGIFLGTLLNFDRNDISLLQENGKKEKLNKLIDYLDYEYIDTVNTDSIVDITVNEILNKLDPHSSYIPSQNRQENEDNMKGDFVGVGISYHTIKDSVAVISTIKGGPSEKAGIKAGDRIVYADDTPLLGKEFIDDSLRIILSGQINTAVQLRVKSYPLPRIY